MKLVLASLLGLFQGDLSTSSFVTSISQFGITWTFDTAYQAGQFANGDWWVLGPVNIISINPPSTTVSGRTRNGSMINPDPRTENHGYDSGAGAAFYVASLNVGRNISAANPLVLLPKKSLISTISVTAANSTPQVSAASILTCVKVAPPDGCFRPPYVHTDKSIYFHKDQLKYHLLRKLTPVANTPTLASVERMFERPWVDHIPGWSGRLFHPAQNMPDYGRELSDQIGIGALMLQLNFTDLQKETLFIRYVQLGIDLQGIVNGGDKDNWAPDGGHASGRKFPILFAGMALSDPQMMMTGWTNTYFGEDAQTFYVRETSPGVFNSGFGNYNATHRNMPEWGIRHATHPQMDNSNWAADYRQCCTANAWGGFILAARMTHIRLLWNHSALFDYMDRYMTVEPEWRQWNLFSENMWTTYRPNF